MEQSSKKTKLLCGNVITVDLFMKELKLLKDVLLAIIHKLILKLILSLKDKNLNPIMFIHNWVLNFIQTYSFHKYFTINNTDIFNIRAYDTMLFFTFSIFISF